MRSRFAHALNRLTQPWREMPWVLLVIVFLAAQSMVSAMNTPLGYAPDEVLAIYDNVHTVYQTMMGELELNAPFTKYQARACENFAAQGHPTIAEDTTIQEGYVHSLGHGLGLHVHEAPWSGSNASEKDILAPGAVFTIEPGLYYPSRGMGCRLEDTLAVTPEGKFEILAEFPLDLVLPMGK